MKRAKPLLASEVLCDELAPLEPARAACRLWFSGIALALILLGVAFRLGVGLPSERLDAATVSFSASGAILAVALLPFPYALRAGVAALVGATLMALGLRGAGPLAGLHLTTDRTPDALRLAALCTLPAALLFRAHYRAYPRARFVLAVALTATFPFLAAEVLLVFDASAGLAPRLSAAASSIAVLCSLLGFMGAGTTGAGAGAAGLLLVALPVGLGVRELTPLAGRATGLLTFTATGIATACAAVLVSLGVFQLLAAALGPAARRLAKKPPLLSEPELEEPRTLS